LLATVAAAWVPVWQRHNRDASYQRRVAAAADRTVRRAVMSLKKTIARAIDPNSRHIIARGGPEFFLIDRAIASMEGLPLHDIADDRLAEYVEDALIGLKGFTTFRDGFQRRASEGGWTRQDTQDLAGFIAELESTSNDISLLRKKLKVR
jgi:hypothetical protein